MGLATGAVLGVLAAFLPRAQSAFEPAPRLPAVGFQHLRIQESPSSALEVSGARLVRIRGGEISTIGCTDPVGPGEILDLALDPAGNTFVAAERGLFLLGPETEALDPVALGEGAPRGRPTSVHVDARRRVWIATDEALGVIDPSFFWGRTIGREDGLDRPGPYRVAAGEDGAILVETPSGVLRYRLDRPAPPAVDSVSIDGAACTREAKISLAFGHSPLVTAEGTAHGGATFRWRIDRHHIWRSLLDERPDPNLAPGPHDLEVIAVDRDLNRSAPFRITLSIDYPTRYQPRFLVLLAASCGVAVVALSVLHSVRRARRGGGRAFWLRGLVGGAIAAALLGQIAAGLVPHAKAWPFVGFSMYTEIHQEGWITYDEGLLGLDSEGRRRRIDEISLGHASDNRWQVLGSILEGGEPVASAWLERYNGLHPGAPLHCVQVVAERRRLTREGPIPIAPLVFGSYVGGTARADR
jgi:hypothetical protein